MPERKQNPLKGRLGSPNVEGQGTTNRETGSVAKDSARKKTKQS